jgi:hypothetical protein
MKLRSRIDAGTRGEVINFIRRNGEQRDVLTPQYSRLHEVSLKGYITMVTAVGYRPFALSASAKFGGDNHKWNITAEWP